MSLPELNAEEARVVGCLIEKSIVTPDQYPLTLNALTNACNQKSSREPVMSLSKNDVAKTIRTLEAQHLVRTEQNFKRGVDKYAHRFCNTRYSELQFAPDELAIVCLLLLRGPQTPGELRSRSGRLHAFDDNSAVVDALNRLINRDAGAVLAKLPRKPGRKDSEYMHLFSGPIDVETYVSEARPATRAGEKHSVSELAERVQALENEVALLKQRLGD